MQVASLSMGLEYAASDTSWMPNGKCLGLPGLMYAHECKSTCNSKPCDRDERAVEARAVCHSCPVLPQCRFWSIVTAEPAGMSGGMTVAERRRLRRKLTRSRFPFDYYRNPEKDSNASEDD